MSGWLWLGLALLATALGQLLYKDASLRRSRLRLMVAIAWFGVAPVAAYLALRSLPLATVYVSTAISQMIVVFGSMIAFGERYRPRQWLGLGLIVAGVIVFNL
jgi:multidrug transporter EmrE-like cation transporter